jgi:copper oxidase (laccase) domain-containing protein
MPTGTLIKNTQCQLAFSMSSPPRIGPAIGPCCYEVSEELAEDFAREFCTGPRAILSREAALPAPRMLDLPAIQEAQLRALGFGAVDRLNFCTKCTRDGAGAPLFYSYRANPGEGRQLSQIRAADGR